MPFPIFPVLSAATSLLGLGANYYSESQNSILQAQVARENTDKTIAANREAAKLAYERDLEQWRRSNQYNHPAEQMARLKSAGLNPMLAYGSGSVSGNTTQATSPKYSVPNQQYAYQAYQMPKLDLMGTLSAYQNYQLGRAQIDNVKAQTMATDQKRINDSIQQVMLAAQAQWAGSSAKSQAEIYANQAKYAEKQSLADLLQKSVSTESTKTQTEQSKGQYPYQVAAQQLANQLQAQNIKRVQQELENLPLQREMLRSQKSLTDYKTQTEIGSQLMQELQREYQKLVNQMLKQGQTTHDPAWQRQLLNLFNSAQDPAWVNDSIRSGIRAYQDTTKKSRQ